MDLTNNQLKSKTIQITFKCNQLFQGGISLRWSGVKRAANEVKYLSFNGRLGRFTAVDVFLWIVRVRWPRAGLWSWDVRTVGGGWYRLITEGTLRGGSMAASDRSHSQSRASEAALTHKDWHVLYQTRNRILSFTANIEVAREGTLV